LNSGYAAKLPQVLLPAINLLTFPTFSSPLQFTHFYLSTRKVYSPNHIHIHILQSLHIQTTWHTIIINKFLSGISYEASNRTEQVLTILLQEHTLSSWAPLPHTVVPLELVLLPDFNTAFPLVEEADGVEGEEWDAGDDTVDVIAMVKKRPESRAPKPRTLRVKVRPEKEKRPTRTVLRDVVVAEDIMVMEEVDHMDLEPGVDGDIMAVMDMDHMDVVDLHHSALHQVAWVPLI
jgi:hypothetical protein